MLNRKGKLTMIAKEIAHLEKQVMALRGPADSVNDAPYPLWLALHTAGTALDTAGTALDVAGELIKT